MLRRALVMFMLTALLGACRSSFDASVFHVDIRTVQATYHPLDNAVTQITNHSAMPVFRDLCSGGIEGRRTPTDPWSGSYGSFRACIQPLGVQLPRQQIGPGGTVTDALPINADAYAGEWRFEYFIYDADGHLLPLSERISNVFQVVP